MVNPLQVIDCVDWDRSEVSRYEEDNGIADIPSIVISQNKTKGCHIFRLKDFEVATIVSDYWTEQLVGKEMRGIAFIRCGIS